MFAYGPPKGLYDDADFGDSVGSGRSEADLIREGIELVSGRVNGAKPRLPLFESGEPELAER